MTVTAVQRDLDQLTLTITAEFAAPVERVWQVWADPRQLERWWGPPTYPATVTAHDLSVGGRVAYYMTGPEGDRHGGWWEITAVEAPHRLAFVDGFADADGVPNDNMPITTGTVTLSEREGGGTTMLIVSTFASTESMTQLIEMGMEEGITLSLGQIDTVLSA